MQYLIQDLLKLPLSDRLSIIEAVICASNNEEIENTPLEIIKAKLAQ